MYIALQRVKKPRVLLTNSLKLMHERLDEDSIPASIIHQDEKTKFLTHVEEYEPHK